ncbi:MAG: hypothetical protein WD638_11340 [Nitriliruptoraceae bacterium]
MGADLGFVIAPCDSCGPVPVEVDRFEIHADDRDRIRLYAFRCPECDELASGGDRSLLDALADAGVPRRRLRSMGEGG